MAGRVRDIDSRQRRRSLDSSDRSSYHPLRMLSWQQKQAHPVRPIWGTYLYTWSTYVLVPYGFKTAI